MLHLNHRYRNWSPLIIRLVIGFGFIMHGYAKISRGTQGFEKLLVQAGVPFPHVGAILTPNIELLGGLSILLGIYVVIVAIPHNCNNAGCHVLCTD